MDINLVFNFEPYFKMLLAVAIGIVVGHERKKNDKPGGRRTFALVCLGSTLISILTLELFTLEGINESFMRHDFARLMSYGLSGMGFIGAGCIWLNKNKVEGLTTASTLWAIVPTGFFIGLGFYELAVGASIMIYLTLESKYILVKRNEKIRKRRNTRKSPRKNLS